MKNKEKNNKYKHLSIEEREIIQRGLWEKKKVREIARELDRSPGTISREINKNFPPTGERRYTPRLANERAQNNRKERTRKLRLKNGIIRRYVTEKLKVDGWSPEQIAGTLPEDHKGESISYEAIYQYIYNMVHRKGYGYMKPHYQDLRPYLKRRHKTRVKKGMRKGQRILRPDGPSIETRPQDVEERKHIGDWETDTVESVRKKPGINTLVDRKSGLVLISRLKDRTSKATTDVITERLNRLPKSARKTITLDNGSENKYWSEIKEATGMDPYYAHPYSSWERGSNENTNGLIRWYLPKGTDFDTITDDQLRAIEYALNTRPRKRHNWRTPLQVFNEEMIYQSGVALTG
jgi:transposase, IS30 family